ncbi:hypothetical protein [Enterobacter kobei]|uniref:hypothetical protein n=1 Tax=Enterobacter kobei TaxID=208224 RepID=UPI003CFB185F
MDNAFAAKLKPGRICAGCFLMVWIIFSVETLDNTALTQARHPVMVRQTRVHRLALIPGFIGLVQFLVWKLI